MTQGLKNTLIPACPLDKQLSNFACPGFKKELYFLVLEALFGQQVACLGLARWASSRKSCLLTEILLVPDDRTTLFRALMTITFCNKEQKVRFISNVTWGER